MYTLVFSATTVDRIIHHSHIFMIGGENYRLKAKLNNSY
nr:MULTISPECIES: ATP-binding protein [Methylobacter]